MMMLLMSFHLSHCHPAQNSKSDPARARPTVLMSNTESHIYANVLYFRYVEYLTPASVFSILNLES